MRVVRCTLLKAEQILPDNIWQDLREALSSGTVVVRNHYQIDCRFNRTSTISFSNGTKLIVDH